MRCRLLLAPALALVGLVALGCGAAPPPAASPDQPPAATAPAGASPAEASAPAAAVAPPPAQPAAAADKAAAKDGGGSTAAPGRAQATSDAPMVTKITQDEIVALVNKNMDLFNRCYTLGAGASKSFRGRVTVKATVSPNGAVNAVEIVDSNTKNPKVDACVGDGFKKLTFERPKGSGATVFTFPMSFDGIVQVQ
jgi:TonB family protein